MISKKSVTKIVNYRSDVASQIKQVLTIQEVAKRYGFTPNRSWYIQCPFHKGDDHGSLKIYPGDRGWCCFSCHKGGTVIDFVMQLFDLSFPQACLRLNTDFNLALSRGEAKVSRSAIIEARRRETERKAALEAEYRQKAAEHRYWWEVTKYFRPDASGYIHPLFAEAVRRLPILEPWLDENMGR